MRLQCVETLLHANDVAAGFPRFIPTVLGTFIVLGGPPQAKSRLYKMGRGDPWTERKFGESMKAWRWLPEIQGGRLDAKVVPFQIEDSHLDIHCKSLMLFSSAPALC